MKDIIIVSQNQNYYWIMSPKTTMILLSLQIITSFFLTTTASSSSLPGGFTIDVIHRRSNSSSSRFSKTDDDQLGSPYANTVFTTSEYLMKLQIGTPPVEIEALIDTASSIVWTQCLPCLSCYNQQDPIFDPSKSSTYKEKKCDEDPNNPCRYEANYADQSYSKGAYATETVTFQSTTGQPFVMAETTIGCGHNNSLTSPTASGIIGLDRGASSLISQMSENFYGFFSYCFSRKETSKINFGSNGVVSGHGTVATTMFRRTEKPNFYYLNLDAISVGENRVETMGTPFYSLEGNIIIDSGTTYTYLPDGFCNKVKDAVDSVVKVEQAPFSGDMLCYNTADIDVFPVITMHFSGGADLVLDKYNMYDNTGDGYCLAISCVGPTEDAYFGNRAQNNLLIGYDSSSELVSFESTDCSALY